MILNPQNYSKYRLFIIYEMFLILFFRDKSQYPRAGEAEGKIEIIQNEGQTIFVPSSWHHQVWNLVNTLINLIIKL